MSVTHRQWEVILGRTPIPSRTVILLEVLMSKTLTSESLVTVLGAGPNGGPSVEPSLPAKDLVKLYETMVMVRLVDERMLTLQRQGRIGFYLTATGEEASHIGCSFALKDSDWIFPAYREPGAAFLRGLTLKDFVCQLYGNTGDPIKGRQMPNHISSRDHNYVSISSPVGTQIPQAVGASWGAKIMGDDMVSLVFFGDGTSSQGDFHVGLNFAGVFKTPTIFLCRNNGYAISVPLEKQTASKTIVIKAKAYGIAGVRVDGNDILAVYEVTKQAAERARAGEGPTLIEAVTYRRGAHSSSDDPRKYRDDDEVMSWLERDPIDRFGGFLRERGIWDDGKQAKLEEDIKAEIAEAIVYAEKLGIPPVETMFDDVYAEIPPELERQKQYHLEHFSKSSG